jgi:hypothetical protein
MPATPADAEHRLAFNVSEISYKGKEIWPV